jgi:uncharacterized protein YbaR (Trm112 family)
MSLAQFAEILRCPETRGKLSVAPKDLLAWMRAEQDAGKLFYKSGKFVTEPVNAGLLRDDGRIFYLVINDIPVLLPEEAILIVGGPQAVTKEKPED